MVCMLSVLMGVAALTVDYSLMQSYRTQLRRAADAAALAGAVGVAMALGVQARDSAVIYASRNPVGGSTATLAAADVHVGKWVGGAWQETTTPDDWTDPAANAVKVTTRFTGTYTFARLSGFTTKNLTGFAVAVHGSVGKLGCVRPWAVPYQSLLDQLGTGQTVTHELTTADVEQLRNATSLNSLELNQAGTDGAPHQARAVRMGPTEYGVAPYAGSPNSPNANDYRDEVGDPCATLDPLIGPRGVSVDDWLEATNGQMTGPTEQGVNVLLCGNQAGNPPCQAQVKVNVAIWDTYGPSTHGFCGACYHVKYMGIFYVTGYNHSGNSIRGYFSSLTDNTGGFVAKIGPVQRNALVQ